MLKSLLLNRILLAPDSEATSGGADGAETNSNEATSSAQSEETEGDEKGSGNKNDAKGLTTIADIAKGVLDKAVAKEAKEDSSSEKAEDGSILSSNQTEEKKKVDGEEEATDAEKKPEGETEGEEKKEESTDDSQLDKHPRFQEVVKQKSEYEAKVKEYEPLVEAHKSVVSFCQENQISEAQFQEGMKLLSLINTDPLAARAAMEPLWNQLNQVTGETLPGDLQQEVTDGLISEARAKEIAKLRGQSQLAQTKQKQSSQEQAKQKQAEFQRYLSTSLDSWSAAKAQVDPKFKPKVGANAPDGKFEFVADRFFRLISAKPPTTVAEAMQYVEQAYTDVSKSFAATNQKQSPNGKSISSTKSSTNSTIEPKNIKDVVANVLARHSA